MAADIREKYPAADTVAITIGLASLASDPNLLAGRESTVIDNTSNNDLDHVVSGVIRVGSTLTAARSIEIWVYVPHTVITGTYAYPNSIAGSDQNRTLTSRNVIFSALHPLHTIIIDSTNSRDYFIKGLSIRRACGHMPQRWGLWIVQNTGAALDATAGNHVLHYHRRQAQTV